MMSNMSIDADRVLPAASRPRIMGARYGLESAVIAHVLAHIGAFFVRG